TASIVFSDVKAQLVVRLETMTVASLDAAGVNGAVSIKRNGSVVANAAVTELRLSNTQTDPTNSIYVTQVKVSETIGDVVVETWVTVNRLFSK
ncbi:MAG: hypothetical protein K2N94_16830, partial [Lachnospiraceae bacterium]|nr:hypothetical protein [Lachnospiraceae bacterium]